MLLRHHLEGGTRKSTLARQLGVSRETIHRWIRAGELDRDLDETAVQYGPRRPRIRAAGYTGWYSQLKALVRQLRPAPPPEPVVRCGTPGAGGLCGIHFP